MENLSYMMAPLFSSKLLLVLFFGTLFGLILGVLPGLGPTTGGALILPFTMTLDPLSALVLLTAIYCAGTYCALALSRALARALSLALSLSFSLSLSRPPSLPGRGATAHSSHTHVRV